MADNNTNVNTGAKPDPFLDELQGRILGQADIISSGQTGLESKITEAISGIQKGQEAGAAKLESEAGRAITGVREAGTQQLTSAREAQRGFGVNRAALKQITEDTEKSVRDLEQRKQELILQGESNAASQISQMQIKAIEFQQNAQQQSFSNLMQAGTFQLQKSQEERLTEQFKSNLDFQKQKQDFDQRAKIAGIAAEFGVDIEEGETLESIVAKVAPTASAIKRAELNKLAQDTKDENIQFNLDSTMTDALANGQSPEQAAMNAINVLTSTTGIEADATQLEDLRQRAVVINDELNAQRAEQAARQTTTGTSFMTSVVNTLTGSAQDERELRKSVRDQERTIDSLEGFGASQEAIERANKKLAELEISLSQVVEREAKKENTGSFFNDLFGA